MEHFIQQTLVFIGSAIILVPIFKYLGLGSVLGYLIAGIIVGPHVLGLIGDTETVMTFSKIGVVFLLFMIGLEIQPFKLWSMRKHLLGLGGLQVLFVTIVFTIFGKFFGLSTVLAIVIGFTLALSSTAFAMQTLIERNQFNTEFGRASFSVLLMQDLVAIPAMAIIPMLSFTSPTSTQDYQWTKIFLFMGILIALFVVSRYLMRPVFRIIAGTNTREIFTATALFIVLGVGILMYKLGLSVALGTFVAGVLLAESEYQRELEANLEPFKNLLMGLFFISVGMSVNLPLVLQKPMLIFSMAAGYLLIKMIIIYGVGRLFGMNHRNSKLMGLNIAQGGEFAFVIFGLILSFQLADTSLTDLLTVVVTFSMALNPLLIKLDDRWSSRGQKKKDESYDMAFREEIPQIIIAGFGRFGQIFGRVMRAQGIPFVAIDHDPGQIEMLRKFGSKVYYGDASRADLLEAAGAANAKYLILAVDDVEESMQVVKTVKRHFPKLKIFARARNRGHVFDLMDAGITHIKRETFDSSVHFVRELLIDMGFDERTARNVMERFRRHDELMMYEQHKVRHDDDQFISVSKQGTAQLAQVLQDESSQTYVDSIVSASPDPKPTIN